MKKYLTMLSWAFFIVLIWSSPTIAGLDFNWDDKQIFINELLNTPHVWTGAQTGNITGTMGTATNGVTLYGSDGSKISGASNFVVVPVSGTSSTVVADGKGGATVYQGGSTTPGGDKNTFQVNLNGSALGGTSRYVKASTGLIWEQDPITGQTNYQNRPGTSGVSMHINGGQIDGMGDTIIYGYVSATKTIAGISTYVINGSVSLGLDDTRNGRYPVVATSTVTFPSISSTTLSGITIAQMRFVMVGAVGVTLFAKDTTTPIYISGGNVGSNSTSSVSGFRACDAVWCNASDLINGAARNMYNMVLGAEPVVTGSTAYWVVYPINYGYPGTLQSGGTLYAVGDGQ